MRIIGFNFSKISIERKEKLEGKLEINQNVDIKEVVKEEVPFSSQEALKVKFNFSIIYSKGFAKLEFEGQVILLPEKDEMKKFFKSWKDKKIPEDSRVGLFNFIMGKCNIKALELEDELNLPLHVPMPKLAPGKDK